MPKRTPDAVRARIIADLLAGEGDQYVLAERHGVSQATVSRIFKQIPPEALTKIESEREEIESARRELNETRESIPFLVENLLSLSLKGAGHIASQLEDEEWRSKQNAADLAKLFDSLSDKSIRILSAIESANERREERARQLPPHHPAAGAGDAGGSEESGRVGRDRTIDVAAD